MTARKDKARGKKAGKDGNTGMDSIILRMGNVVKEAASEEAARKLEARGFVRDGTPSAGDMAGSAGTLQAEAAGLKKELLKAAATVAAAVRKKEEAETALEDTRKRLEEAEAAMEDTRERLAETGEELADARKRLEETEAKNTELLQELSGTREQLEAALKKNTAAAGRGSRKEAAL